MANKITNRLLAMAMATPGAPGALNIFGWDDRVEKTVSEAPYTQIVYLPGIGCTGSLVWKNLVLTAAHCVESMVDVEEDGSYELNGKHLVTVGKRAKHESATAAIVELWWGDISSKRATADDWAIVRLDHDLGEEYGYFGFIDNLKPDSPYNNGVQLAGYSADLTLQGQPVMSGVKSPCTIRRHDGDRILHDCDATRGISGAPIWKRIDGTYKVVGISVGENRGGANESLKVADDKWDSYPNVGVNVRAFAGKLHELVEAYPKGND